MHLMHLVPLILTLGACTVVLVVFCTYVSVATLAAAYLVNRLIESKVLLGFSWQV